MPPPKYSYTPGRRHGNWRRDAARTRRRGRLRYAVSPYTRAALFLIRLIAAGFVICSLCLCSSDLFLWLSHHPPHRLGWLVLKGVPLLIGLAIFWKSEDIAKQLTKDLD